MSAEIIPLPIARGNGAREALVDIVEGLPGRDLSDAVFLADWLLLELALRGFVIAPLRSN